MKHHEKLTFIRRNCHGSDIIRLYIFRILRTLEYV